MVIAIQGGRASFHEVAAREFFSPSISTIECPTFKDLMINLENGKADFAMMAIENTIAGSILGNYTLLQDFGFPVIGEIRLRIVMCLMALKGSKIEDIHTVKSHYMALLQCGEFLQQHPHIKVEEFHDTADAAKHISQNQILGQAAIAGKLAAEHYDLDVLASGIETFKMNYTRFLVLSKNKNQMVENPNKASLSFVLYNEPGSLSKVLNVFHTHEVNLTKIQSIPLLGSLDEYTFYVDCDWQNIEHFEKSVNKIKDMVNRIQILGKYQKGRVVETF
ncbi:MAG: prephenate dehydratase [Cytophagales bacterium]